jgi:hypothetical protein
LALKRGAVGLSLRRERKMGRYSRLYVVIAIYAPGLWFVNTFADKMKDGHVLPLLAGCLLLVIPTVVLFNLNHDTKDGE